eukprot:jgi/Mesvir1/22638/Mv14073-RA.1
MSVPLSRITGGSLAESREAMHMAEMDGRLFSTVGVHPTRCNEFENASISPSPAAHLDALHALIADGKRSGKVVAVGECGLDYDRLQFCDKDVQKKYFEQQFALSQRSGLPMFLHMRAAADDFLEILHRNRHMFPAAVVHSFTGTVAEMQQLVSVDNIYIGINGCSLKTEENLEVIRALPLDRIMLETDAPWCDIRPTHAGGKHVVTSWPSRKKEKFEEGCTVKGRNEPCHIRQVLEVVAACRGVSSEHLGPLANTIYENTCRVFFPNDLDTLAGPVLSGQHP